MTSFLLCSFPNSPLNSGLRERLGALYPKSKFVEPLFGQTPRGIPVFVVSDTHGNRVQVSPFGNEMEGAPGRFEGPKLNSADLRSVWTSLDRVYLKPLSMLERERIWDGWISGWNSTIEKVNLEPTFAFFPSTPHFHWDIALAMVLQERNVRVFSLSPSVTDGLLLLGELQGSQISHFMNFEKRASQITNSAISEGLPSRIRLSREMNSNLWRDHTSQVTNKSVHKRVWRELTTMLQSVQASIAKPAYWPYGKATRLIFSAKWLRRKSRILQLIDKNGFRSVPTGDFAYFALHFQPERSTTPEAGDYWAQIGAIRKLRRALPDSFELIVGEHPRQILLPAADLRQTLFRSLDFYKHIDSIPGVKIAHFSLKGLDLIAKARLVGTCTGSSAWEAMRMGIPSVVFGKTAYSISESCLDLSGVSDARLEIGEVLAKTREEVIQDGESVYSFAAQNGVPGYTSTQLAPSMSEAEISSVANLTAERLTQIAQGV